MADIPSYQSNANSLFASQIGPKGVHRWVWVSQAAYAIRTYCVGALKDARRLAFIGQAVQRPRGDVKSEFAAEKTKICTQVLKRPRRTLVPLFSISTMKGEGAALLECLLSVLPPQRDKARLSQFHG
jgi:hypothetical protein